MTTSLADTAEQKQSRPPLDPRLIRGVPAARRYVISTLVLGTIQAVCVIAMALAIAHIMAQVLTAQVPIGRQGRALAVLTIAVLARGGAAHLQGRFAHRAATDSIAQLRRDLVRKAAALGPRWLEDRGVDLTVLLTQGLENLRPYLTGYVPQLFLAATVTPLALLAVVIQDVESFVFAVITIPLIPVFMILIGKLTEGRSEKLLADMRRLSAQALDLVAGLPTLKALGRERGPAARIRMLGEAHRRSTMATLRYAFLSSMALEFLATLSVALIAVGIGLRLVTGSISIEAALAVLILAPEIYLPLRQVGVQFHASTDGVAATSAAFEILETPAPADGARDCPDPTGRAVRIEGLTVRGRGGRAAPADLNARIEPGAVTVLAGGSGDGKTTTAQALLRLIGVDAGSITLEGEEPVDLATVCRSTWWPYLAYLPQRPVILPGTVRDQVVRDLEDVSADGLAAAARATGLDGVLAQLPEGWETPIGHGGYGVSLGQRQRIALTRTLLRPEPILLLDEPTAHLDPISQAHVMDALRILADEGRTVIVIAHRERLIAGADAVITVTGGAR